MVLPPLRNSGSDRSPLPFRVGCAVLGVSAPLLLALLLPILGVVPTARLQNPFRVGFPVPLVGGANLVRVLGGPRLLTKTHQFNVFGVPLLLVGPHAGSASPTPIALLRPASTAWSGHHGFLACSPKRQGHHSARMYPAILATTCMLGCAAFEVRSEQTCIHSRALQVITISVFTPFGR